MVFKDKSWQNWHVKIFQNDLVWCHCLIHQEALCAKTLDIGFKDVMHTVVDRINYIRSHALNHRQFKQFLTELEASYGDVFYFSAVRWLSRGQTLRRFWDLREELKMFLEMKGISAPELSYYQWLCDLAFLVDITEKLNNLNTALQGKDQLVHEMFGSIRAFELKLQLWQTQLQAGNIAHFPSLKLQHEELGEFNRERYSTEVGKLKEEFKNRFEEFRAKSSEFELFSMPFTINPEEASVDVQMELIELQSSMDLKAQFLAKDLKNFYKSLPRHTYPNLVKHSRKYIALFGSTYNCEQFFSKMKNAKCKKRTTLTDEHLQASLRIASTALQPDFNALLDGQRQFQVSH